MNSTKENLLPPEWVEFSRVWRILDIRVSCPDLCLFPVPWRLRLLLTKVRTSQLTGPHLGQLSAVSQSETWLEAGWPMRGAATRSLISDRISVELWPAVRACNIFVSPWWCSVFWSLLIFRSLVDVADRHNVLSDQGPREGLHQFHPRPLHRLSDAPLLPDPLVSPDGSRCQALRPFHFNWS